MERLCWLKDAYMDHGLWKLLFILNMLEMEGEAGQMKLRFTPMSRKRRS